MCLFDEISLVSDRYFWLNPPDSGPSSQILLFRCRFDQLSVRQELPKERHRRIWPCLQASCGAGNQDQTQSWFESFPRRASQRPADSGVARSHHENLGGQRASLRDGFLQDALGGEDIQPTYPSFSPILSFML